MLLAEFDECMVECDGRLCDTEREVGVQMYQRHYNSLVERYDAVKARFDKVAEFDSQLWASMVECVTVEVNSSMTVVFRDGTERRL